jgi:hypothetical protein
MQVVAVSTPRQPAWRWRIVNYAGEVIEESQGSFPTIALAVADGSRRLKRMDGVDRSVRPHPYARTLSRSRPRG